MRALVTARQDRGRRLDWIAIGSTAGQDAPIPSAALRASGLSIVGSGQGSVGRAAFVEELPGIVAAIADHTVTIEAQPAAFSEVETRWSSDAATSGRVVFTTVDR
jgi:hypothetical protein